MLNLLTNIAQFFISISHLIVDSVKSLVNFIINIPTYLNVLRNILVLIPDIYLQYSLAFIIISGVLYALGRQQNG